MFQFIVSEPTERKTAEIKASGPYITDRVHKAISGVMNDKYMRSPNYAAVTEATAFFQGGSESPNSDWYYIEFWKPEGAQAYVDKVNAEFPSWSD